MNSGQSWLLAISTAASITCMVVTLILVSILVNIRNDRLGNERDPNPVRDPNYICAHRLASQDEIHWVPAVTCQQKGNP